MWLDAGRSYTMLGDLETLPADSILGLMAGSGYSHGKSE
jgi:hypothetical protein